MHFISKLTTCITYPFPYNSFKLSTAL